MSEVWVLVVTVISTFAGCGGSSLGYKMAGYKELLAIEWDKNATDERIKAAEHRVRRLARDRQKREVARC